MSKLELQLPDFTFYLDENLGGKKVSKVLTANGMSIEIHSAHFSSGTPDDQWLPEVGKRGWILLTQDQNIRKRRSEIMALREFDVRAFIVVASGLRGEEIGDLIVSSIPQMLRILNDTHPPLIAMIRRDKIVELKEGARR